MRGRRVLPRTDQRGMILVVTLMIVLMLALLGSAILTTSGTEHQIAKNDQEVTQAFYVAEAGLQTALNQLNRGLAPPATGAVGPGEFTVTVASASPPLGQQRIEATGYVPTQASPRALKKIAVLVTSPSPFLWAIFGDTLMKMGTSFTDSYDSGIGPYGGSNVHSNGNVASNGDINISSGALVTGNATAGGTVSDPSRVTGMSTNGAPRVTLSGVNCPAGGYTPSVPPGPGVQYTPSTGVLKVTGGGTLTLSAPGTYYFHDVTVSSGATLGISSGGHVDIYIDRKLDINGGGLVNPSAIPANLMMWGCGTDNTGWALNSGDAYFAIYTPTHQMTVGSNANLYGAIVAANTDFHGSASIHYDEALARQPWNGKFAIVRGSWTELLM